MSELHSAPLCYLASPYSRYPSGHVQAFIDVSRIAAKLMISGVKVYSPICHSHPIATYGDIDPLDHSIWLPFEERFMEVATVLIVARMPGWEKSFGVTHEIEFFGKRGKPIYDLNPDTMTMTRRLRKLARDRFDGVGDNDLESDRRTFLQNNPLPLKGPSV